MAGVVLGFILIIGNIILDTRNQNWGAAISLISGIILICLFFFGAWFHKSKYEKYLNKTGDCNKS